MAQFIAISVEHLKKSFKLPHEKNASIKSALVNFRHKRSFEVQQVLNDISFEIPEGEFFGIVGRNGSGKSTLLKLLAGIYSPTSGILKVNGRLTPFIELGVGFNQELTGRENVFLNGALLGFSRREMTAMYDDIVAFAELERFMDQKLKNYSSGMQVRLAFSIAIQVNSDILLLDEVLAVGDAAFQKKCFDYFRELKKNKKTVVFISHDMNAVREYCDKAMLLEKGEIVLSGTPDKVADAYTRLFAREAVESKESGAYDSNTRWGSGKARANKVTGRLSRGKLIVEMCIEFEEPVESPLFGVSIYSPVGVKIYESNTKWQRRKTGSYKPGQTAIITWEVPNIFTNGRHSITAAVANTDATEFYDNWEEAAFFTVDKDEVTTAVTLPKSEVKINVR